MEDQDEIVMEAGDDRLWGLLSSRLVRPEHSGLLLGAESVAAIEVGSPAIAPAPSINARLRDIEERAASDLAFESTLAARRQPASLGRYLLFLRSRAGLSAADLANKVRLDFQLLADLERDALSPKQISGARLAGLVRRLKGSLEMTERLLLGTVRAPRLIAAPTADSSPRLYRGARGASRSDSAAASQAARGVTEELVDNPEYAAEIEAVQAVREELRRTWNG
jgi:transcriptional regulator with XRE-family HTH domain